MACIVIIWLSALDKAGCVCESVKKFRVSDVKKISFLILAALSISACDGRFASLEASELRKRAYECEQGANLTAPEIQVCKNIMRECKKREANGQYDC